MTEYWPESGEVHVKMTIGRPPWNLCYRWLPQVIEYTCPDATLVLSGTSCIGVAPRSRQPQTFSTARIIYSLRRIFQTFILHERNINYRSWRHADPILRLMRWLSHPLTSMLRIKFPWEVGLYLPWYIIYIPYMKINYGVSIWMTVLRKKKCKHSTNWPMDP